MQNKNLFYILLFLAMIGWGGSWVNVKVLSQYIDEYEMVFIRFSLTALSMIPIILFMKKSFKISLRNLGLVFITSLVFIAYMKYFFLGTKYGTAGLGGAMVTSLIPINTFLIMAIFFNKRILLKDTFALILGAVGIFTMLDIFSFDFHSILSIHNLYFLLASILWPCVTILSSRSLKISPIVFTFYLYLITSLIIIVFFTDITVLASKDFDTLFYFNIFCIVFFASTYANTVYFLGIEKLGTNEVSSFIFLVPFAALILSALFLNESIHLSTISGVIMTLIAVKILNNIKFKRKKIE